MSNPRARVTDRQVRRAHGRSRCIGYAVVVAPGERVYDRASQRYRDNVSRCEGLLTAAQTAGVVHQWGGSRGLLWWNGAPGSALRALGAAIGGEHVPEGEDVKVAARRVGNLTIAGGAR
jgi:hypothetical protein